MRLIQRYIQEKNLPEMGKEGTFSIYYVPRTASGDCSVGCHNPGETHVVSIEAGGVMLNLCPHMEGVLLAKLLDAYLKRLRMEGKKVGFVGRLKANVDVNDILE